MTGHPPFLRPVVVGWGAWRVGLGRQGGRQRGRAPGAARRRPRGAAGRSCAGSGPLPRAGAQLVVDSSCSWGGWLVLVRGIDDSVTSTLQCILQSRPRVYLMEGTYHTRLFAV
jgi:hypothetical protein